MILGRTRPLCPGHALRLGRQSSKPEERTLDRPIDNIYSCVVPEYDIGMLRVFLLVYETGSVTTSAERLYISQPSVSYTLRRLRLHFGDPLFQRRGQRLEPTSVADELYPKLRRLLESMDDVMARASSF